ncbi:MAG: hypothetical protein QXY49_04910 [Thermofilaceae archaeon]
MEVVEVGGKGRIAKIPCSHCDNSLVVEVKQGTTVVRCTGCGGYTLILADMNADIRDIRPIEVTEPLNKPGRLRLARPELWPSMLERMREQVIAALRGEGELTPEVRKAVEALLKLGVLEPEGG